MPPETLDPALVVERVHGALAGAGRSDEADLALLASLVIEAVSDAAPSRA